MKYCGKYIKPTKYVEWYFNSGQSNIEVIFFLRKMNLSTYFGLINEHYIINDNL